MNKEISLTNSTEAVAMLLFSQVNAKLPGNMRSHWDMANDRLKQEFRKRAQGIMDMLDARGALSPTGAGVLLDYIAAAERVQQLLVIAFEQTNEPVMHDWAVIQMALKELRILKEAPVKSSMDLDNDLLMIYQACMTCNRASCDTVHGDGLTCMEQQEEAFRMTAAGYYTQVRQFLADHCKGGTVYKIPPAHLENIGCGCPPEQEDGARNE